MFGLSTWEVLIILVVALIFVGPDQLPKVARTISKGVQQVRGAMGKVDGEMRRAMREAAAELDDDGEPVTRGTRDPVYDPVAGLDPHALPPEALAADGAPPTPPSTAAPSASPTTGTAASSERDWSQVGKAPPGGRVATSRPARPVRVADLPAEVPAGSTAAATTDTATAAPGDTATAPSSVPPPPTPPATT